MTLAHLHVHSHFSLMEGTASVRDLCQRAKEQGYEALALTDTNALYGLPEFLACCREFELRPIIGAELVHGGERCVALVRDEGGFRNLCRLVSAIQCGEEKCRVQSAECRGGLGGLLEAYAEGLIFLSDQLALLQGLRQAGAQVYAEVIGGPNALSQQATKQKLPVVATNAVRLLDPQEHSLHRLLRAIHHNTSLTRLPASEVSPADRWLWPPERFDQAFEALPRALMNTAAIAAACQYTGPGKRVIFPAYDALPEGTSALQQLRALAYDGARSRYGKVSPVVRQRLEKELAIIGAKGFADYFLVVREIALRASRTCGRGSGAASLVAYSLGITNVDPIKYNLYFERFLNMGRIDPPDIDMDFCHDERDAILAWTFERFGRDRTAMVCNHLTFQPRMAIREVAKVYGLPDGEITARTRKLPYHTSSDSDPLALVERLPALRGTDFPEPWPEILRTAWRLIGMPRHLSVHPGGTVITPGPITDYAPIQPSAKGPNVIQWEKDGTEDMGLVKIDILSNRNGLPTVRDAIEMIRENEGIIIDSGSWRPTEDQPTIDMLAKGSNVGIFYVESPATRQLQIKAGKGDFEHLVIHSSIIRPAANTYINEYVRRLRMLDSVERRAYSVESSSATSQMKGPSNERLSQADRLAEEYGFGREGLPHHPGHTEKRTIWPDQPDSKSSGLRSSEHSRGLREDAPGRLSQAPVDSQRIIDGIGDSSHHLGASQICPTRKGVGNLAHSPRNQPDADQHDLEYEKENRTKVKNQSFSSPSTLDALRSTLSLHPALDPILAESYGIMVYQEHVSQAAEVLAGFPPEEADNLRRVMSKKDVRRKLEHYRGMFTQGALGRGVSQEVIDTVWGMIESFAGYSFCKPHSASYAQVSFQAAYLRCHHPAEFLAGVLSNEGGFYSPFAYVSEARRLGITVLGPDVNLSRVRYRGRRRKIRVGLMAIGGLRDEAKESVVVERERGGSYASLEDLLRRARLVQSDAEALIDAGACDALEPGSTRPQLHWQAAKWFYESAECKAQSAGGKTRSSESIVQGELALESPVLCTLHSALTPSTATPPQLQNYDQREVYVRQWQRLGYLLDCHPMELYAEELRRIPHVRGCDLPKHAGRRITMVGWHVTHKTVSTYKHEPMQFISFEDTTALYETVLFPQAFERFVHLLDSMHPYVLHGTAQEDFGCVTLQVDGVERMAVAHPSNLVASAMRLNSPSLISPHLNQMFRHFAEQLPRARLKGHAVHPKAQTAARRERKSP